MKKFVALYYSPKEAMAQMANLTEEDKMKGIEPWMTWKEKCGNQLVDMGAPLAGGQKLDISNSWKSSSSEVSGYSIVQGESLEAVQALFVGHPHLSWYDGCEIEINEMIAM